VRIFCPAFQIFERYRIYYPSPFLCCTFCFEIHREFAWGSPIIEWIPPPVPNENCLLKLSRLSSVVTYARSQKPENDVLILYRRTTPQKLTNIKFNKKRVSWFFSVPLFALTFKLNNRLFCCIALVKLLYRVTCKYTKEKINIISGMCNFQVFYFKNGIYCVI